jgi:hypothetical protein
VTDFAAREKRRLRRERRRAALTWAVLGVVSVGVHHLSLQALDVAGLGIPGGRAERTVMLDLFEPIPAAKPATPPPVAEPPKTPPGPAAAEPPAPAEPPKPEEPPAERRTPRRPRTPRLPRATETDEDRGAMTLSSDYGEPYDPLNPRLRMSDWGSE